MIFYFFYKLLIVNGYCCLVKKYLIFLFKKFGIDYKKLLPLQRFSLES